MVTTPPSRYPDLFAVLNVLISTPVFVLTWLWSIKCGIEISWALGGLGSPPKMKASEDAAAGAISNGIRQSGTRAMSLGHTQSKQMSQESIPSRRSSVAWS